MDKGARFRALWRRPSWVRIPPPAFNMKKLKIYYSKQINLNGIKDALNENFGVKIEDAGYLYLPENAYNKIRGQYNAILLLSVLPSASLWIVDKDIYTRGMNFVFGVAFQQKAIVSSYRLTEKMVIKEAVHEVGHIFGLEHCRNECVMQFSNSLAEAIKKPSYLCSDCKKKITKDI